MKSANFEFLRAGHRELADLGGFAEAYAHSDPQSSLVKLRMFVEQMVETIYDESRLRRPYDPKLNNLLQDPTFQRVVPRSVWGKMDSLRYRGNKAAHGHPVRQDMVEPLLKAAWEVATWFHMTFNGGNGNDAGFFTKPKPATSKGQLQREKRALAQELNSKEVALQEAINELEKERKERAKTSRALQEQLDELQNRAEAAATELDFSEEQTRRFMIEAALVDAGWNVGENGADTDEVKQELLLHEVPNRATGDGYADYVLFGDDGNPLAVIEAKKAAIGEESGRTQVWTYAEALQKQYGVRPAMYYTNGHTIMFWDDAPPAAGTAGPPRKVYGFHSKDSLQYLMFQRENREPLELTEANPDIAGRMYQLEAIKRVTERFASNQRRALIVQATGTGKTRVAISICELLIRARWAKRILFLCDRRELRKQADGAFKEHLAGEPRVFVTSSTSSDRNKRIYLATYPAMMSCFESFDVGFFDLVVADESHRSIYNKYQDLFRYFDACYLGLTATPVKLVDRNTYDLFGCPDKEPTFFYSLEQAIKNVPPYLVPFRVTKVTTRFQREGIGYGRLSEDERRKLEDQLGTNEVDFTASDMDRSVFNKDTTRHILRNLMENGIRDASGTLVGKSIVFARSHKHAEHMAKVFYELYPTYGGHFCRVIDNYDKHADQLIDDFKDPEKELRIAISVDMMDTGIDVPEVVNLVFAKPVKSYVKFWQMIGRGTRLCPDLFGPGEDKTEFRIFDHWGNFDYFDDEYQEEEPERQISLLEKVFVQRVRLAETAIEEMERPVFELAIKLLEADLGTLQTSRAIAVRDRWMELQELRKDGVLEHFDAATQRQLLKMAGPLMRWADIRGHEDAYRFDLLVTELQVERLLGTGRFADLKGELLSAVDSLLKNLKPVQAKAETIRLVRSKGFWDDVSVVDLEDVRTELRSIMKHRARATGPGRAEPSTIDLSDSKVERVEHIPTFQGQELIAYRNRVEGVLKRNFESHPILAAIKAGQAVTEEQLEELAALVNQVDPMIDLKKLPINIHAKGDLHRALRSIIGLEGQAVENAFQAFSHKHGRLTAQQQAFLRMLKNHICNNGGLEVARLYEAPFTSLDPDSIDGVFADDEPLIDELLELLEKFNLPEIPQGGAA